MAGPYFVKSGTGGTTGADWANACNSIKILLDNVTVAGDETIYCHNTHANNAGAAITWTFPETGQTGLVRVLSVDGGDATGASLSGTTVGSLYEGATEETGGSFAFTITSPANVNNAVYMYGLTLKTNGQYIQLGGSVYSGHFAFSKCTFYINSASAYTLIYVGYATDQASRGYVSSFNDCVFRFGGATQGVVPTNGTHYFNNCSLHALSSNPTHFFYAGDSSNAKVFVSSCDLSIATNAMSWIGPAGAIAYRFNNCLIGTPTTGTITVRAGFVEFHACGPVDGTNGPDLLNYYYQNIYGVVEDSQTVYLTTGSAHGKQDDGTETSYSLKMDPTTYVSISEPLYTPWFYAYVGSTGSKTVTVKAADTESAVLKDTEPFLEVEYVGDAQVANSPQSQRATTAPVVSGTIDRDVTAAGSNLTDTAEAWTGITETGTYTLSKTITVDEYGYIRCRVGLAKDTTNPVYVDPKITVS